MDQQHDREAPRKRAREIYEHLELSAAEWATPEQYREHLARVDADLAARPIDAQTLELLLALERERAAADYQARVDEFAAVVLTESERGALGPPAKAKKKEPLREAAVRMAIEGGYANIHAAATALRDEILALARRLNITTSEDRAVTDISEWLKAAGFDLVAQARAKNTRKAKD